MKYLLATLVALAATVFAGVEFGVRAGYNVNNFSFGYEEFGKKIDMGYGFGVGLALNVPIVSIVRLNAGADFYWREFFKGEIYYGLYGIDFYYNPSVFGDMQEIVASIPITLQFGNSLYFAAGAQLDFPIYTWNGYEKNGGNHIAKNRASMDIGLVLGLGYRVTNIGLDLKYVHGLTRLFEDFNFYDDYDNYIGYKDKSWLGQYGLCLTYFF